MDDTASLPPRRTLTSSHISRIINPSDSQRQLTICAYLALFALGLPFWWYTTSIERLSLPKELDNPAILPNLSTGVCLSSSEVQIDIVSIWKYIEREAAELYGATSESKERPWHVVPLDDPSCNLEVIFEQTADCMSDCQVRFLSAAHAKDEARKLDKLMVPIPAGERPEVTSQQTLRSLSSLFPSLERSFRALAFSPNITLSFVLLNEDGSRGGWVDNWDIKGALDEYILPILSPLTKLHRFSIETQILYHAPLRFEPSQVEDSTLEGKGRWMISQDHMKNFVNSEQWSLDSGSSSNPVLRFLLFVPSSGHTPMHLNSPLQSPAFLIPQYGGVVIHNAWSADSAPASLTLTRQDLRTPFSFFSSHLNALLAVPSPPCLLTNPHDAVDWQVNTLLRMRTKENFAEAAETLRGIKRLVGKIREMKVGKEVRRDVVDATGYLNTLLEGAQELRLDILFGLSRDAVWLANRAFFNPTMVGLLYFPDEHKYAVYAPLFAPVAVPIVFSTIKEMKRWLRIRRKKRAAGGRGWGDVLDR